MKKIIVYGELNLKNNEIEDVTFELLTKAQKLTQEALKLNPEEKYCR